MTLTRGIDLAGPAAGLQQHLDVLGGVLVGELDLGVDLAHPGCLARHQCGQAGPDVGVAELLVASDTDFGQLAFDDGDAHRAVTAGLLGQEGHHGPKACLAVEVLNRQRGLLELHQAALAGVGRQGGIDRGCRQQGVAGDGEGLDADLGRCRRGTGRGALAGALTGAACPQAAGETDATSSASRVGWNKRSLGRVIKAPASASSWPVFRVGLEADGTTHHSLLALSEQAP